MLSFIYLNNGIAFGKNVLVDRSVGPKSQNMTVRVSTKEMPKSSSQMLSVS